MYLIKELGLEKCKQIVDGAPDWANKFNPETNQYSKTVNVVFLGASYATHIVHSQVGFFGGLVSLNDLRTEIAEHDKCQHEWNETTSNGDAYRFFVCKHCDSTQNYVPFKDDNPSHFDHCTDICYHISPLTRVIEK